MIEYQNLIKHVFENGYKTDDRTGTGTIAVFGTQSRFDASKTFPLITTKKMFYRAIFGEALWFMQGKTNIEELREITHGKGSEKSTIWDLNYENQGKALGYKSGNLGPIYGHQWRNFGGDENTQGVDQLFKVIEQLKSDPTDRRMIVNAWNPRQLNKMALPPCHMMFQFNVHNGILDLMWYQRSVDVFLGLPFNIASYAFILKIVAMFTGLKPGEVIFTGGNTHIYMNHIAQCEEILSREPLAAPSLIIPKCECESTSGQLKWLETLQVDDFKVENYKSHPAIKGKMAV